MIEVALKNIKYLQFIDQNLIISRKTSSFWQANMFFFNNLFYVFNFPPSNVLLIKCVLTVTLL